MKILNSLVKGASKALDKTPSWLSNFGVSKYLYKNLALTAFALGAPLYVGAQGTQNALDRIDTKNHIEASAEGYEGTKEKDSKTINYSDAITNFYGDQVVNPFEQPNYTNAGNFTLDYYGSGDADGNNIRNWEDYDAMVTGTTNDRTDVNGDGFTNTQDENLLYDYLTDQIPYISGADWNFSTTAEKTNWFEKMLAIDLTDQIPYVPGQWECDQYAMQTMINFSGIENIANSGINFNTYDTTMNARFNLPIYRVSTRTSSNVAHAIVAVVVSEPSNNFSNIKFYEPQDDSQAFVNGPSLNNYANLNRYCYFFHETLQQYMYGSFPVLNFNITGTPTVTFQHPDWVVNKPVEYDYINIGGQGPSDINLEYQVAFENQNPLPSVSGDVTGNAAWSSRFYSDSTNRVGTTNDSTFFNFNVWRDFWAISDSSALIDTMYMTNDTRYTCDDAQLIEVRDTEDPNIARNQTIYSMLYSEWLANGIALSTITDNSNYWDSTHVQTNTQGAAGTCDFYNFVVTDSTTAWDPTGNLSTDVFTVNVSIDSDQWDYFPGPYSLLYTLPATPENTNGPATAINPAGPQVDVTWDTISYQNPDPNSCEHYNYPLDMIYTKTNSICTNMSSDSIQPITKYKPNALVSTNSPPDTIYIGKEDPKDPPNVWEPTYSDTLEPQFPTSYTYEDFLENVTATDSTWRREFTGYEDVCNTSIAGPNHILVRDLTVGINEGGLKKELKRDYVKAYPNPTKGKVKLEYDVSKLEKINTEVYDLTGRLIEYFQDQVFPGENQIELDLSRLANGTYFIQNSIGGEIFETEKIVINK